MALPSPRDARFQAAWAAHRPYLLAVAAGMLKRQDDAEDVVQEAFARLATASPDAIEDVRGWLVVVTRRLCLDRLNLAENRRATATAEPPEASGGTPDPADRMLLHDEVRQALSVVIGRLSPAERTSFILHDIFGFPFDAVAGLVGRTPVACRQLARRARLSVGAGSSHAELAAAWSDLPARPRGGWFPPGDRLAPTFSAAVPSLHDVNVPTRSRCHQPVLSPRPQSDPANPRNRELT
jgi:RNA polymerase sigma factor (sigma-70 family)